MTLSVSLPSSVVGFWREAGPKLWYAKDAAFDAELRHRFEALHHAAAAGDLKDWLEDAEGSLAYALLTDQVPRNLYRGSAHAFATDGLARAGMRIAIGRGHDLATEGPLRQFLYMPFEHSEDVADQAYAIELATAYALAEPESGAATLKFARIHADVIARFGRFPHRNEALGRTSMAEEIAFLAAKGFRG